MRLSNKISRFNFIGLFLIILSACIHVEEADVPALPGSVETLTIPDGFDFGNTREVVIDISMPNSIDFGDYKGRFDLFSDDPAEGGKHQLTGSFDEQGRYRGVLEIPASQNQLYLISMVDDSLIVLEEYNRLVSRVTLDLSEYFEAIDPDSLAQLTQASFNPPISNRRILAGSGLVNGDFSENDFGYKEGVVGFSPDEQKMNFLGFGVNRGPMTWYPNEGNGSIGTEHTSMGNFGVSQTFAVQPGQLITFDADVKSIDNRSSNTFYTIYASKANGGLLKGVQSRLSRPRRSWKTRTVSMTMPEGSDYCIVTVTGGDWTNRGSVLFDNLSVSGNGDSDGDGIEDEADDYPDDSDKAYRTYYPNAEDFGTLAFEDTWPGKGDYDFNDMVVDYQYEQVFNSDNKMVQLNVEFRFRAAGASYHNGFGFEMEVSPSAVAKVSGNSLNSGLINTLGNGTESGQSKATIIVTDDVFDVLQHPGVGNGVNSSPDMPYVEPVSLFITVDFVEPLSAEEAGYAPFNPFIFVNGERGREVHLPGYTPTSLVDSNYFGTEDDDTDPGAYKYYMTESNLPWGINLPTSFEYPTEGEDILDTYVHYSRWAQSGGYSFMDWYMDRPGYKNEAKLYKRP